MNEEILSLFKKYIYHQCSPVELEQVISILKKGEYQEEWNAILSRDALEVMANENHLNMRDDEVSRLHDRIMFDIANSSDHLVSKTKTVRLWRRIAAAASIVICVSIGFYFYRTSYKSPQVEQTLAEADFKPGGNKAILTLAGGKQILLAGAPNGQLALQGNVVISKTADGKVVYSSNASNSTAVYNTMSTPLGGQYQLTLADGTKVWLNAGSSISYPTAFTSKDRQVNITGEVYFEVAHNTAKPFIVKSNGQTVKVLGTHFNINAYQNENTISTTLLEGSVNVSAVGYSKILKPGQQSAVNKSGITVTEVDTDGITAWKEGYFDFTDADIKTIMRQFSRWYDVDIQFEEPATTEVFTGRIPRKWSLNQVMKAVQSSKSVHLKVEGRRIMVKQ